ncbi:hypothetical protein [Salmonella enterica]|uniref:hypothetical protein n=1 Tax=Salmonella enterica TaxID=28901 RepID=UPI0035BE7551
MQLWWDKDADVFYLARVWKKSENTAVQAWVLLSRGLTKYLSRGLMTVTNTKRAVVEQLKTQLRTPVLYASRNTQRSRMAVTQ